MIVIRLANFKKQFRSGNYRYNWQLIGLRRDKIDNNHRINQRVKKMIEIGLIDEVKSLLAQPQGLSDQAAQAVGYAEIIDHLNGKLSLDDAIEKIKINTRRFAKAQRTWFKTFTEVNWLDIADDEDTEQALDRIMQIIESKGGP